MTNFFSKINSLLFRTNIFSPLRERIFLSIVSISILISSIGAFLYFIFDFSLSLKILALFSSLIFTFIFIKAIKRDKTSKDFYFYFFWVSVFIVLLILWLLDAGFDSHFTMLFLIVYIGAFLTFKTENRVFLLVIALVFLISSFVIEVYFPELFVINQNKSQRMFYVLIKLLLYLSIIHYILSIIWQQNNFEQIKLKKKYELFESLSNERKELNEKLKISMSEMEALNRAKDGFISIIAHDLRSPFQGLLGVSRFLNENYYELNDEERKELIKKLNNLLESQYSFLEELLLWGRLQRSGINMEIEKVNLKEIILSEISHFAQIIGKKKLHLELFDSIDIDVMTVRNLISTVIRNILSNAIKFSPIGQKIEVFVNCVENTCFINIKDYGLGISEEDQANLFKIDKKVSRKGTDGETGTGLGLVLCLEIMTKLNGKLLIESKEGIGTIVTIEIPKVQTK